MAHKDKAQIYSDDTSIAVLEKDDKASRARIRFHETVTANNARFRGIHPLTSLESHQAHLPGLVRRALHHLPQQSDGTDPDPHKTFPLIEGERISYHAKPTFVCATRGPGMRSSLSAGLDLAKGLALGLSVPLVGVHHMQAHALTPRLAHALAQWDQPQAAAAAHAPAFPFLTLLASGGHTLLLQSASLTSHRLLAETVDVPIGNCIDQVARLILPPEQLAATADTGYGRLLEALAFPPAANGAAPAYDYVPPATRGAELAVRPTEWGWALTPPLADDPRAPPAAGAPLRFSFSGLQSAAGRIAATGRSHGSAAPRRADPAAMPAAERRDLAREVQRVAFEHLAGRVAAALQTLQLQQRCGDDGSNDDGSNDGAVSAVVVGGGVAANRFLRHVLRAVLDARGFAHVKLAFPPPALCTDNAAMIAWAGLEMWEAGWASELGCLPLRRWGLDDAVGKGDGGVLGVGGWRRRQRKAGEDA